MKKPEFFVRLSKDEVQSCLPFWTGVLGKANSRRLKLLIGLDWEDDRINFEAAMELLFPRAKDRPKLQMQLLTNFRLNFNGKFLEKFGVCFCSDTHKRSPPSKRFVWFEGDPEREPIQDVPPRDPDFDLRMWKEYMGW